MAPHGDSAVAQGICAVRWSRHAGSTPNATRDETFMQRVNEDVDALLARNLYVGLDLHRYRQLVGTALLRPQEPGPAATD